MGTLDMGSHDFDFQIGRWSVRHRRLRERLVKCTDWEEFHGTSEMRTILGGRGNVEDNVLHMPDDTYRAIALRSFDASSGTWAIWWLDGRAPHSLDVPVIGRFVEGVGEFFADDTHDGTAVKLRFLWMRGVGEMLRWEQALSADGGATWETNWTMDFTPA